MRLFGAELLCVALAAAAEFSLTVPLGLDAYIPVPEDNPLTEAKIALGRDLFHEKRLSRDASTACVTCHEPQRAFTDGKPVAAGVFGRTGNRRTPAIVNRAYGKAFFWDGRVATLEEQVLQPILNPKEMDLTLEEAVARLAADARYAPRFRDAFSREASQQDLARALASYVRTILSGDSAYDRYVAGERSALGEAGLRGLRLFRGKAGCLACHVGPNLSDERFHNTGVGYRDGVFSDNGRGSITRATPDTGAFKTPTLRDVARSAPYMHDGSLARIEDVVEHYDKGGVKNPHLAPEIQPLKLTSEEKRDLIAFLRSLNGKIREGVTEPRP